MAQASTTLSPKRLAELEQRQRHAVIVLALQRSKRAIEAEIRAKGHKLSHYSARDLRLLAERYFDQHRAELVVEAMAIVEQWTAEGFFGKRAQRAWRANLVSAAQSFGHCSDKTISVQMSSAERRADQ